MGKNGARGHLTRVALSDRSVVLWVLRRLEGRFDCKKL
jgi:hypothetical protein